MIRMWCYLRLTVADVSSHTASGPCNHSRSIKCMPLGVTVVQGWNVSLCWNPAGSRKFFSFCNYFELCGILCDRHTTITKAISFKPPEYKRSSFWTSRAVWKRQLQQHVSPDVHAGVGVSLQCLCVCVSVLMSCRLESLSLWLLVNLSQDTIVAANTGFWSPVPGRNANWNLISHPSTNYRSSAPTHELSKNWGERVGPLLGLIV